ncbi:HbrB-like-domain-containing protein [Boletus coccyginus]|nr:HbrB-like-domain-containing protein [Boletus coccyginus]
MVLGLGKWTYDSEPSSPTARVSADVGIGDNAPGGSDRLGQGRSHHRRTASSNDATPRPRAALPRTGQLPDFDPAASLGRHNTHILTESDPVLSSSSHQPSYQQTPRCLGFFPSNTATHSKTSPSRAHFISHLDPRAQPHLHSRSEITAHKDTSLPKMTSAASSSAVNKVHVSPSKPSTRTYDAKAVTREMHRLGTLAGLNPASSISLASNASASTVTLAPSASPSTVTLVPCASHNHGVNALSGATASDKDNPWGTLHVHVLPLFNEEPLRVPIEDLNALVRRHIQTVLAASPSKALTTLATDARELIGAGIVTINAKMASLSDELLPSRLVELWSFFWDHILPYIEGVLLPLQTDPLLTSLHRTAKQHRTSSPTRQGPNAGPTVGSHAAFSPTIDVRSVALCAFRDRVVVPLHSRLHSLLSPTQCKETLVRLGSYRQPRLQQMLLVLTSERRVRPPSPTLSLRAPDVEPSAGEAAVADLLRLFSQTQHHARAHTAHHNPRQSYTRGLMVRASTPSFLSAGLPRDRRGRIGGHDMKRMILSAGGWPVGGNVPGDDADADAEDEGGNEGNETPRVGTMEYRDRKAPPARPGLQHAQTGGWGLGAGNEEKEVDDDDDEAMNWDQAQAAVERMIGMKPESPTEMRRRVG